LTTTRLPHGARALRPATRTTSLDTAGDHVFPRRAGARAHADGVDQDGCAERLIRPGSNATVLIRSDARPVVLPATGAGIHDPHPAAQEDVTVRVPRARGCAPRPVRGMGDA